MADCWAGTSRLRLNTTSLAPKSHPDHLIPKFSFSVSGGSLIHPPLSHHHPRSLRSRPERLHISPKATSFNLPLIPSCDDKQEPHAPLSPNAKFLRFWSEKFVICLLGSFIFVGFVHLKPSFALSSQAGASSPQAGDAQEEGSDEEEMSERLLETDPMNVDALKVVLYGKMRRGKTKEAVKYVQRLVDVEPDEVEWKLLLALCHETMGQLSTAKRLFREILKETPLLLRALHGLAMVMHKNQEGPAVFEMLNKALELACHEKRVTEERNIRILIAQMHVIEGDLNAGLKDFQDLVNDNPRDFRPYLCQGIIYSLLDKKKEAQEQFEAYRSLVPEEFPQRGFLDDVVLAAKSKTREQLQKEFKAEFRK
ncbi:protein SLOW GREEN 1, chloroplastic-like [Rhodamnia argentea]|uniref:Protein SLOW GREEN 1, chloroplastic-like n=1 Tax=Rhodamnia argentea TaxID=178133 RepID=A0ABM3H4W4_9MYRT|nr:protein SLOW GREEN 1, chloroplastic-like [Rhodamnia argentea]